MSTIQETSENLLRFCGDQKYATIYADPPWRFQNRTGKVAPEHKRLNRYETMELEDIMRCRWHRWRRRRAICICGYPMPCFPTALRS